jgi:hypothetical protein
MSVAPNGRDHARSSAPRRPWPPGEPGVRTRGAVYFASSRDGGDREPPCPGQDGCTSATARARTWLSWKILVVTAIVETAGDGDLLAWRSADDGRTWIGPSTSTGWRRHPRGLHGMASGGLVAVAGSTFGAGTQVYAAVSGTAERPGPRTSWPTTLPPQRLRMLPPFRGRLRGGELAIVPEPMAGRAIHLVRSADSGGPAPP